MLIHRFSGPTTRNPVMRASGLRESMRLTQTFSFKLAALSTCAITVLVPSALLRKRVLPPTPIPVGDGPALVLGPAVSIAGWVEPRCFFHALSSAACWESRNLLRQRSPVQVVERKHSRVGEVHFFAQLVQSPCNYATRIHCVSSAMPASRTDHIGSLLCQKQADQWTLWSSDYRNIRNHLWASIALSDQIRS